MSRQPSVSPATLSPCTCFKVRSLARRVTQLYDDTLAPSGLRITQFSLLVQARRLGADHPPTVTELAAAMFTDRTTLTRNLRPMIDAGLISLQTGADARSKAVVVTEAGERAYREARELWKHAQKQVRSIGGLETIEQLQSLIDGLLVNFDEHERGGA